MSEVKDLSILLNNNSYPGRGIVAGKSLSGKYGVVAYFIMGRSANSRNRVFKSSQEGIVINAFDPSKLTDPSLIIYSPVKKFKQYLIVTNGDQTDTIFECLSRGETFTKALSTRCFEPDSPNFTPRISCICDEEKEFNYALSILKAADKEGSGCNRFTFEYASVNGMGHFISTYNGDGMPLPSFTGEPLKVAIGEKINTFADNIWQSLNTDNKVSLYVRYTHLTTKNYDEVIINKNK